MDKQVAQLMLAIDHDEYFLYPHYEPVLNRLQNDRNKLRTSRKRRRATDEIKEFARQIVHVEYPHHRHPHVDGTLTR